MLSLFSQGYVVLFVIITLGILLGNVRIKGFSLDLSAVIFVALVLGHFGFKVPLEFQTIGLLFFIFTIGIQAGPGFFDAFRKYGRNLIIICTVLITSAAAITYILAYFTGIEKNLAVGIFNGALTSTPGLAAAIDATGSSVAAVGYGVAYPLGVIGVILFVQFIPGIFRTNLQSEERVYNELQKADFPEITNRKFLVENVNVFGKRIDDLKISSITGAVIARICHNEDIFVPTGKTQLNKGDIIKAVGTHEALNKISLLVGHPVEMDMEFSGGNFIVNWVLVTNKKVINKPLQELNFKAFNSTITRIRRSSIDISPRPTSTLRFGDRVLVSANKDDMDMVLHMLGNDKKRLSETNFLPIALGIIIGVMLGEVKIPFLGLFDFKLGVTGGVLSSALILSKLGKTGPIIWSMSGSANQLLRKLGLLMFLAAVGTNAGSELVSTLKQNGLSLVLVGGTITIVPMLLAVLVGKLGFKMNMLTLLGVITGSMTSTPGLGAVDAKSSSEAASVGYATVYPVALVLMIVFSQVLTALLS